MTHDYSKLWAVAPLWARCVNVETGSYQKVLGGVGADGPEWIEIPERERELNTYADDETWEPHHDIRTWGKFDLTGEEIIERRRIRIEAGLIDGEQVEDDGVAAALDEMARINQETGQYDIKENPLIKDNGEPEPWVPEVGDAVEALSGSLDKWYCGNFVAMDGDFYIIRMEESYPFNAVYAGFPAHRVRKTETAEQKAETADWDGRSKPPWSVAPKEANWLCQDLDGSWSFWESKPHGPLHIDENSSDEEKLEAYEDALDSICMNGLYWTGSLPCADWNLENEVKTPVDCKMPIDQTLEARPETPEQKAERERDAGIAEIEEMIDMAGSNWGAAVRIYDWLKSEGKV